jgi:glycosyltransferase involved in cell wall biosynthesis
MDAAKHGGGPPDGTADDVPMRILVVSFRFPPFNSVGAVSVGKTVKYLVGLGHDVRVITARDQRLPTTLPLDVHPQSVIATAWFDPMRLAEWAVGGRRRVAATGFSAGRKHDRLLYGVGRLYRSLMIPDREIGWALPAFAAGHGVTRSWRPDVIYASAPPYTSLLVASALASQTGIPWIAGLRDLWSDNPYRDVRSARLDRALEARVLNSAAGIVVTTEEAERVIRDRFRIPTATVMNGYDPDDLRERTRESRSNELRIVYTGVLIHDQRDPAPLFEAMRAVRAEGRAVAADFFGRDSAVVEKAAERFAVRDAVEAHAPIPYSESLQVQRDADVLLLLQGNNPLERMICPAKLFEYAAARRPVLGIGPRGTVAERLLRQYGMGTVVQDRYDIAAELRQLIDRKAEIGTLPDVALRPPDDLSRRTQVERLSHFLASIADGSHGEPSRPRTPSSRSRAS